MLRIHPPSPPKNLNNVTNLPPPCPECIPAVSPRVHAVSPTCPPLKNQINIIDMCPIRILACPMSRHEYGDLFGVSVLHSPKGKRSLNAGCKLKPYVPNEENFCEHIDSMVWYPIGNVFVILAIQVIFSFSTTSL